MRIAYCALRIGQPAVGAIAYCVSRIAYWAASCRCDCVLLLHIVYCVFCMGVVVLDGIRYSVY